MFLHNIPIRQRTKAAIINELKSRNIDLNTQFEDRYFSMKSDNDEKSDKQGGNKFPKKDLRNRPRKVKLIPFSKENISKESGESTKEEIVFQSLYKASKFLGIYSKDILFKLKKCKAKINPDKIYYIEIIDPKL